MNNIGHKTVDLGYFHTELNLQFNWSPAGTPSADDFGISPTGLQGLPDIVGQAIFQESECIEKRAFPRSIGADDYAIVRNIQHRHVFETLEVFQLYGFDVHG